ncbi:hypothetical protein [Pedobacter sp. UYP30]|uniref:hypothetical protein n=1 Tax=Pedobacter sp. UYP30 TaxID=1756400 RepID=UPI00339B57E5
MSLLISNELDAIKGGAGTAQDTVDYMLAENISNYSSSNGYSSSGGDFGFGTGSTPIDLGTVDIYGQRTGSSGSTFTGAMNYGTGYSSNSGFSSNGGYDNGGYDSNGGGSNSSQSEERAGSVFRMFLPQVRL